MFTGIIQACGQVAAVENRPYGIRLVIDPGDWKGDRPAEGDSVCVNGVCLTVVGENKSTLSFDVVAETLSKTTLGEMQSGARVNLEPALTLQTPLGGHFVQGHVDGVGLVKHVQDQASERRITIDSDPTNASSGAEKLDIAIIPKGSVAIDGVSLTVAAMTGAGFDVALIPTTIDRTTLGNVREGDRVNIETDIISKTVVHWLGNRSGVTMQTLQRAGFLDG